MAKTSEEKTPDIATRIMEHMVRMPPKQHKDMKLGKPRTKAEPKERPAPKGRVAFTRGNREPKIGHNTKAIAFRFSHSRFLSYRDNNEFWVFNPLGICAAT